MPDFTYIARDLGGNKVTGSINAANERDVIQQLGNQQLFPIEVTAAQVRKQLSFGGVSQQKMANFYGQLASLLRNGVPLMRSLKLIQKQTAAPALKEALADVIKHVEDGDSVGDAFARHPKIFNHIAVNMARAGAEGGFLEDALERVSEFTEQQADLKARTAGALIYPILLMIIGTLIVTVLLIFFVPKFNDLFETLRAQGAMPWTTEALLGISGFLQGYWVPILVGIAILLGSLWVYFNTESGRRIRDLLKLKAPLFGNITRNLAVARFCRVLGTLLKNGVPILKSLEISAQASGNSVLADAIDAASDNVTAGASLAVPLEKSGHFPHTVTEMISVAEEANTLDDVLVNIADNMEKTTARRLDLLVRMLEPIMLLIMAGVILFIVSALLMPIMNMSSAVG